MSFLPGSVIAPFTIRNALRYTTATLPLLASQDRVASQEQEDRVAVDPQVPAPITPAVAPFFPLAVNLGINKNTFLTVAIETLLW
jgi:hypothetical protein